jgi:hypothetical protein
LAVASAWEAVELVQEWLWPDALPWLRDVFFWDGAGDIAAAAVGTAATFPFLKALGRRFETFKPLDV